MSKTHTVKRTIVKGTNGAPDATVISFGTEPQKGQTAAADGSSPAAKLSDNDHRTLTQWCGDFETMFKSIESTDNQINDLCEAFGMLLVRIGAGTDYGMYQQARAAFVEGLPKGLTDDAIQGRWTRVYNRASERITGLPKGGPVSMSPEAVEQREKRAAKKSEADALRETHTVQQLREIASAALTAGEFHKAKIATAAAEAEVREKDKTAREKVLQKFDPMAKDIREAVARLRKAGDIKGLTAIHTAALKASPKPAA